jgi:SAM-dependent methyltransferase
MKLIQLAKHVYRAIGLPAGAPHTISLLRYVLLQPRVFDLLSLFMQARDEKRLVVIEKNYASEDSYVRRVHDYNAGKTLQKVITSTRRAELLYKVIVLPPRDLNAEQLLIIGPRNIQELLIAWLYGFRWKNIQGIDLYSTNPKIHTLNMESMTFADATFDAVVMSNTLAYAADTYKCLAEIHRVLKPGGRLVFGATYDPRDPKWAGSIVSGEQMLDMLRRLDFTLYYYVPTDKINASQRLQTSHLFGCRKRDPSAIGFDRITW